MFSFVEVLVFSHILGYYLFMFTVNFVQRENSFALTRSFCMGYSSQIKFEVDIGQVLTSRAVLG